MAIREHYIIPTNINRIWENRWGKKSSIHTYRRYQYSLTPGSLNDYRFVFVKGLAHAYPNGDNHWMEAAQLHWEWLEQYELP